MTERDKKIAELRAKTQSADPKEAGLAQGELQSLLAEDHIEQEQNQPQQ